MAMLVWRDRVHVIAASLVLNTTCSINMFYSTKPKPASVMELGEDVLHQVFWVARVFGTTSRVSNTVTSYYMLGTLPVAYTGFLHLKTFTDIRLYESIIEESLGVCLLETIWSTTLIHPVKLEIDLVRVGASVGKAPGAYVNRSVVMFFSATYGVYKASILAKLGMCIVDARWVTIPAPATTVKVDLIRVDVATVSKGGGRGPYHSVYAFAKVYGVVGCKLVDVLSGSVVMSPSDEWVFDHPVHLPLLALVRGRGVVLAKLFVDVRARPYLRLIAANVTRVDVAVRDKPVDARIYVSRLNKTYYAVYIVANLTSAPIRPSGWFHMYLYFGGKGEPNVRLGAPPEGVYSHPLALIPCSLQKRGEVPEEMWEKAAQKLEEAPGKNQDGNQNSSDSNSNPVSCRNTV